MAMSDCVKCWDTPCTCGHDLKDRSLDWLQNQLKIITAEIDRRAPKDHRVELLRFGVVSPYSGVTLVPTLRALDVVKGLVGKTLRVTYGGPTLPKDGSALDVFKVLNTISDGHVCGRLSDLHYDDKEQVLSGTFNPAGPLAEKARLLFEDKARLSIRAASYTRSDKRRELQKIVTFDLTDLTEDFGYAPPKI